MYLTIDSCFLYLPAQADYGDKMVGLQKILKADSTQQEDRKLSYTKSDNGAI